PTRRSSDLLFTNLGKRMGSCYFNGIGLDPRVEEFLAFRVPNFSLITGIGGAVTGGLIGISCIGRTHDQQSNRGYSAELRYVWFGRFNRGWLTAQLANWIKRSGRQFWVPSLRETRYPFGQSLYLIHRVVISTPTD